RLDLREQHLRVQAEDESQDGQGHQQPNLPRIEVGEGAVLFLLRDAGEHPLVGPQEVDGGQHDADRGDRGPRRQAGEAADEDQELADEAVEAGQADRGEGHEQEEPGEDRRHLLETAELRDQLRVPTVVDHPDEKEQGTGGDAVVDVLDDRALEAAGGERERAQDDEPEVGHRRVGDQLLQVGLDDRHYGPVDDADHRQRRQDRDPVDGHLGKEGEVEPHQAVGAELQHDAGQEHRTGGGGLDVGVGQPRVEREHRHLDGERQRQGAEQEHRRGGPEVEVHQVLEGEAGSPELGGVEHRHGDDRRQQPGRPEGRGEEELDGGIAAPLRAPDPDDEVHRDQHRLEEDEEEEQVEGHEHAQGRRLEHERVDDELLAPLGDGGGGRQRDRDEDGGEDDERHRDAVYAEVPGDAPRLPPHGPFDELVPRHRLERHEQVAGEGERQDREGDAQRQDDLAAAARDGQHHRGAEHRQQDQPREH